jgi:hypothetical protein
MPGSDSPRVTRLLPDTVYQAVKAGTAVIRLETTHDRQGVLDGAWWPRSRDIAAELPALIAALTEHLGPIIRISLDTAAWEELPTRLIIDDRVVRIDSFPIGALLLHPWIGPGRLTQNTPFRVQILRW